MSNENLIEEAVKAQPIWVEGATHIYESGSGRLVFSSAPIDWTSICTQLEHIEYRAKLFEDAPDESAQFYCFGDLNIRSGFLKDKGGLCWYDGNRWTRTFGVRGLVSYCERPTPEEYKILADSKQKELWYMWDGKSGFPTGVISIMFRNGEIAHGDEFGFAWSHNSGQLDIVAYTLGELRSTKKR